MTRNAAVNLDGHYISVPIRTVSETNQRCHWRAKAARVKKQRFAVAAVLSRHKKRPLPCEVILERVAPRELDDDNLCAALKAVRDEIAAWLGVDDRDKRVLWFYGQSRGKVREYSVGIYVYPYPFTTPASAGTGR